MDVIPTGEIRILGLWKIRFHSLNPFSEAEITVRAGNDMPRFEICEKYVFNLNFLIDKFGSQYLFHMVQNLKIHNSKFTDKVLKKALSGPYFIYYNDEKYGILVRPWSNVILHTTYSDAERVAPIIIRVKT